MRSEPTSVACCLLRATWAAITRCLSTTRRQFAHWQSRQRQKRLWPFRHDTTPWFRQRAHLGLRVSLRVGCCCCSSVTSAPFPPPPLRAAGTYPSMLSTSISPSHSDLSESSFVSSSCRPLSSWVDIYVKHLPRCNTKVVRNLYVVNKWKQQPKCASAWLIFSFYAQAKIQNARAQVGQTLFGKYEVIEFWNYNPFSCSLKSNRAVSRKGVSRHYVSGKRPKACKDMFPQGAQRHLPDPPRSFKDKAQALHLWMSSQDRKSTLTWCHTVWRSITEKPSHFYSCTDKEIIVWKIRTSKSHLFSSLTNLTCLSYLQYLADLFEWPVSHIPKYYLLNLGIGKSLREVNFIKLSDFYPMTSNIKAFLAYCYLLGNEG